MFDILSACLPLALEHERKAEIPPCCLHAPFALDLTELGQRYAMSGKVHLLYKLVLDQPDGPGRGLHVDPGLLCRRLDSVDVDVLNLHREDVDALGRYKTMDGVRVSVSPWGMAMLCFIVRDGWMDG